MNHSIHAELRRRQWFWTVSNAHSLAGYKHQSPVLDFTSTHSPVLSRELVLEPFWNSFHSQLVLNRPGIAGSHWSSHRQTLTQVRNLDAKTWARATWVAEVRGVPMPRGPLGTRVMGTPRWLATPALSSSPSRHCIGFGAVMSRCRRWHSGHQHQAQHVVAMRYDLTWPVASRNAWNEATAKIKRGSEDKLQCSFPLTSHTMRTSKRHSATPTTASHAPLSTPSRCPTTFREPKFKKKKSWIRDNPLSPTTSHPHYVERWPGLRCINAPRCTMRNSLIWTFYTH